MFTSDVAIARSDSGEAAPLRNRPPDGANWGDEEWRALLDGALGPWAFAMAEGEVVSICHCARLWERGAEAGVWTHPDHRRRGYAAAVTAAWAALAATDGRELFYSTSADNDASQRVAARLKLRPTGWIWAVHRAAHHCG
jgi:RimJ/RimL family protein N-acetyltransferase